VAAAGRIHHRHNDDVFAGHALAPRVVDRRLQPMLEQEGRRSAKV